MTEARIRKEGYGHSLTPGASPAAATREWGIHEKPQSWLPVAGPKYEPVVCWMRSRSSNNSIAKFSKPNYITHIQTIKVQSNQMPVFTMYCTYTCVWHHALTQQGCVHSPKNAFNNSCLSNIICIQVLHFPYMKPVFQTDVSQNSCDCLPSVLQQFWCATNRR
jgi:hypothetical protein